MILQGVYESSMLILDNGFGTRRMCSAVEGVVCTFRIPSGGVRNPPD